MGKTLSQSSEEQNSEHKFEFFYLHASCRGCTQCGVPNQMPKELLDSTCSTENELIVVRHSCSALKNIISSINSTSFVRIRAVSDALGAPNQTEY